MIESVNSGIGAANAFDEKGCLTPDDKLNPEQKNVITFVLNSRDNAVNISGAAGTGKTVNTD